MAALQNAAPDHGSIGSSEGQAALVPVPSFDLRNVRYDTENPKEIPIVELNLGCMPADAMAAGEERLIERCRQSVAHAHDVFDSVRQIEKKHGTPRIGRSGLRQHRSARLYRLRVNTNG
jgi:hypothetical protein